MSGQALTQLQILYLYYMFTRKENYQEVANTIQGWDATQEEALLSRQLLSNIEKCGDHITIMLTGKGISAIAKAIHDYMDFVDLPEDTPTDDDVLLSKQDVKDKFSVSDTTLWLWGKKNYLVPIKIGRRVMYRSSDIKRLVNGK